MSTKLSKSNAIKQKQAELASFIKERIENERESIKNKNDRAVSTAFVKEQIAFDEIGKSIGNAFKDKIVPSGYSLKKSKKAIKRIVNVAFSDTHYQTLLTGQETASKYGPFEEARATAKVILEAVEFKTQYRDNTKLIIHIFGDIIAGTLHDLRTGATITEQFAAAVFLLTQAITFAAAHYPTVEVKCTTGNHGRIKARHGHKLAINQKWDSYESMIYFAIKMAVKDVPNVSVDIPLTPYYTWNAFDKKGFITHGDTVLDVGFPSSTIDIKKIRNQVNEWNAGKDKFDLFMVGHVHCGAKVHLPTGAIFMSNGCLLPPDEYAVAVGHPNTQCGQWVFESVEGHIVGDSRFITINDEVYTDNKLDSIIKPYLGFESPNK